MFLHYKHFILVCSSFEITSLCWCCRKLYVVLSVVLCLLASSLVAFFLFPRSVIVVDDGIHSVSVRFDRLQDKVLMNMTVGFLSYMQHTV